MIRFPFRRSQLGLLALWPAAALASDPNVLPSGQFPGAQSPVQAAPTKAAPSYAPPISTLSTAPFVVHTLPPTAAVYAPAAQVVPAQYVVVQAPAQSAQYVVAAPAQQAVTFVQPAQQVIVPPNAVRRAIGGIGAALETVRHDRVRLTRPRAVTQLLPGPTVYAPASQPQPQQPTSAPVYAPAPPPPVATPQRDPGHAAIPVPSEDRQPAAETNPPKPPSWEDELNQVAG